MTKKLSKQEPMWQEGIISGGFTLREYYAGLAMQGILANPELIDQGLEPYEYTELAIKQADSLIKALEEK